MAAVLRERPQAHLARSGALAVRLDAGGSHLPILGAAQMLAKRIRIVHELGELAHRDKFSRFAAGHGDNTVPVDLVASSITLGCRPYRH